ncbi:hypothetical protein QOT17_018469 [Balamuthia mandrillaris]
MMAAPFPCALLLLACFNLVLVAHSETCEKWDRQPELCSRFQGYAGDETYIYVPEGSTLAQLKSLISSAINIINTMGSTFSSKEYCNTRYLMLACATLLRPCETLPLPKTITGDNQQREVTPLLIPKQPCRELCEEYNSPECQVTATQLGLPLGLGLYFPKNYSAPISCINETEFAVPFYLEDGKNVTVPLRQLVGEEEEANLPEEWRGGNWTMSCNAMSVDDFGLSCVEPLVPDYDNNRCVFECPLPSYSEEQYENIKILQLVFGWLSWAGSLLVALSYGVHPSLRAFPANLILMTAIATNIATFAIILPTFATYQKTWCGVDDAYLFPTLDIVDEVVGAYFEFKMDELLVKSHLCSFQGFVLMFGFLSTTMWWVIISFNMFLTVYFRERLPTGKLWNISLQVTYHGVGWVVPFVLTLIPTAADRMAFGPGDTFCFVSPEDNRAYFITFWALPVAIALLVGLVLFAAAIVRILRLAISLGEGKKACMTYYRLGLFILIFMIVYACIFAYTLQVATNLETIEEGYSEYFTCLITGLEGCTLSEEVNNYHLAGLKGFAYAVLGFLLFLNFCLSEAVGKLWWRLLKGVARGRLPSLRRSETSNRSSHKTTKRQRRSRSKSKFKSRSIASDRITMSLDSQEESIP